MKAKYDIDIFFHSWKPSSFEYSISGNYAKGIKNANSTRTLLALLSGGWSIYRRPTFQKISKK